MAPTVPQASLLVEFQLLHETVISSKTFACLGITKKKVQCRRSIGPEAKDTLSILTFKIFRSIEKSRGDIEQLIYEASCLVMCHSHQDQAEGKLKTWMEMGSSLAGQNLGHELDVKQRLPLSGSVPSGGTPPVLSLSDQLQTEAETSTEPQIHDQTSSFLGEHSSSERDFEDSGYHSGGEDTIEFSPAPPVRSDKHDQSSDVIDHVRSGPKTPKKPSSLTLTDSAISMSFYTPKQSKTDDAISDEEGPPSPLAGKTTKSERRAPATRPLRPAPTPLQPKSSGKLKTSDARPIQPVARKFNSFSHPSEKLVQYIKKPLGITDLNEGYIYSFQVDGCRLNKIGSVAQRKNEKDFQRSFAKRMREHTYCGWRDAKPVGKFFVPHVHRVEKIIHYHFEARRRKEVDMADGSNGRTCKHKSHTEWFDVSLDEIWTVALAWSHWIRLHPYVESKSGHELYCLGPEWKDKLNTLTEEREDHWLQWLCRYSPQPSSVLEIVVPDISYSNGPKEQDQKYGSLVTISVAKIPEDQDNGEMTAETKNPNSHQLEFVVRLKPSQTWPRKIQAAIGEKD